MKNRIANISKIIDGLYELHKNEKKMNEINMRPNIIVMIFHEKKSS